MELIFDFSSVATACCIKSRTFFVLLWFLNKCFCFDFDQDYLAMRKRSRDQAQIKVTARGGESGFFCATQQIKKDQNLAL